MVQEKQIKNLAMKLFDAYYNYSRPIDLVDLEIMDAKKRSVFLNIANSTLETMKSKERNEICGIKLKLTREDKEGIEYLLKFPGISHVTPFGGARWRITTWHRWFFKRIADHLQAQLENPSTIE